MDWLKILLSGLLAGVPGIIVAVYAYGRFSAKVDAHDLILSDLSLRLNEHHEDAGSHTTADVKTCEQQWKNDMAERVKYLERKFKA